MRCRSESVSTFLTLSCFIGAAEDGDQAETFCRRRNVLKIVIIYSLVKDSFKKNWGKKSHGVIRTLLVKAFDLDWILAFDS